jgi:phosphate transport system substrate-binding protein
VGRIALIGVAGIVLGLIIYFSPRFFIKEEKTESYPTLSVGGTSVVDVIAKNRWKSAFRKDRGIDVNYESTGTTSGIEKLIDGKFAVAFTHAPLSEEQMAKASAKGPVLQIPILLCGIAPVYNVKELKAKDKPPVKFTGEVLADIYLGKITKWDDKALKDLNPDLPLPPTAIKVVHRKDSSGTTYLLTEYLCSASKAWRDKYPQPSSEIKWPEGMLSADRNLGIATQVYKTEGAIGYVDRMYTSYDDMELRYGAVKNQFPDKPTFVTAEPDNMKAALQGAFPEIKPDLTFSLANKPGPLSYPISGVIYAVCYENQPAAQYPAVNVFLHWVTNEGQAALNRSSYAPLPTELVSRLDERLKRLRMTQ